MNCPRCQMTVKTVAGLAKHLKGSEKYGGHGLTPQAAAEVALATSVGPSTLPPPPPPTATEVLTALAGIHEDSAAAFLRLLLLRLVADKQLPKMQFERPFSPFIQPFLTDIVNTVILGEATYVAPEFPLKNDESYQTTNADHLLHVLGRDGTSSWVLVEIKTDSGSVDLPQLGRYLAARQKGFDALLQDVLAVRDHSMAKAGYTELLGRIDKLRSSTEALEIVYLSPQTLMSASPYDVVHFVRYRDLIGLRVRDHAEIWAVLEKLVFPALIA